MLERTIEFQHALKNQGLGIQAARYVALHSCFQLNGAASPIVPSTHIKFGQTAATFSSPASVKFSQPLRLRDAKVGQPATTFSSPANTITVTIVTTVLIVVALGFTHTPNFNQQTSEQNQPPTTATATAAAPETN
jgi:hypothetical protein